MQAMRSLLVLFISVLMILPVNATAEGKPDTLEKYSFRLEIDGVDAGLFTSIEGLGLEQEVIEYQNGDDPLLRKRPGRLKYGDITLTKNYSPSSVLNDWIEEARLGNGQYDRKTLAIILLDQGGNEIKRWNLFETFPSSWSLSTLSDGSNTSLTETLVIACEWFEEA